MQHQNAVSTPDKLSLPWETEAENAIDPDDTIEGTSTPNPDDEPSPPSFAFIPQREEVVVVGDGGPLVRFRLRDLEAQQIYRGRNGAALEHAALSSNGRWLAASFGGELLLWEVGTEEPRLRLSEAGDASVIFAFHPTRDVLYAFHKGGLRSWDLDQDPDAPGKPVHPTRMGLALEGRHLRFAISFGNPASSAATWWQREGKSADGNWHVAFTNGKLRFSKPQQLGAQGFQEVELSELPR